jgi:glycosyltransferase involved in cell wall biosynthesis
MRIPIALVILDPGFGGGHKHVLDLASHLPKHYEPVVICSSKEVLAQAHKQKVATVILPASRFFGIEDVKPLRHTLVTRNILLIHAHGPRAGWACFFAKANLGVPMVYTDHAWNPDYAIQRTRMAMQLVGLRLVCRSAQKVIAVSQKSREFLVGRGIAKPEKTVVIPNGIALPSSVIRHPSSDPMRPIVGSVGVFNVRKGHDVFVQAIPHVLAKNPKVKFAIIGDGPERINVEKLAIRLGIRRFIHMPGAVSDKERDTERKKWTLYVQSSRDESFGIAAAEALAMGIPVVATNVGGLPDVIDGGGLIVEKENPQALAEAVLKLLSNTRLRLQLSKRGQAHVRKQFALPSVMARIEGVYGSVVPSR